MKRAILDFFCGTFDIHLSVETTVKPARKGYTVGIIHHQCRNCRKFL